MSRGRREFSGTLLAAGAGAALILLAMRRPWAAVTFSPPRPLPAQVVSVSGQDLVPAAAALALAALACLAAVIATRGVSRRVCGGLLGVFGASAGIAAGVTVSAGSAVSVAASLVGSPASAALSGGAGSTTSGSVSGGTVVMTGAGTVAHVALTATGWRIVVLAGALLILAAGVAVVWRGPSWPVMSGRYELSPRQDDIGAGAPVSPEDSGSVPADSAAMWESLSRGADPTDEHTPSS